MSRRKMRKGNRIGGSPTSKVMTKINDFFMRNNNRLTLKLIQNKLDIYHDDVHSPINLSALFCNCSNHARKITFRKETFALACSGSPFDLENLLLQAFYTHTLKQVPWSFDS